MRLGGSRSAPRQSRWLSRHGCRQPVGGRRQARVRRPRPPRHARGTGPGHTPSPDSDSRAESESDLAFGGRKEMGQRVRVGLGARPPRRPPAARPATRPSLVFTFSGDRHVTVTVTAHALSASASRSLAGMRRCCGDAARPARGPTKPRASPRLGQARGLRESPPLLLALPFSLAPCLPPLPALLPLSSLPPLS